MRSVVTLFYDLDIEKVFQEVTSALVELGFTLKSIDKSRQVIEGSREEGEFHPHETIHVRIRRKSEVTCVDIDVRPPRDGRCVGSISDSLDVRIGDHSLPGDPKAPLQEVAVAEGRAHRTRPEERSVLWAYVPVSLNLVLAFFGSLGIVVLDEFLCFIMGPATIFLFVALILMAVGLPKGGAVMAIIGGVLTFPIGVLGLLGGVWAWVLADKMRRR
jgi:hypothetical protein